MQAYATAERPLVGESIRSLPPQKHTAADGVVDVSQVLLETALRRLADLVVERLLERTTDEPMLLREEWLDARAAAEYLGVHRDTVRKLAAERSIPAYQDAPGCKLYFRRDEIDEWRRTGRAPRATMTSLKAVS